RTRQTLAATGVTAPLVYEPGIYEAAPSTLVELVRLCDEDVSTLLVVGHAPGMPRTAWELAGNRDDDAAIELGRKFPTSALAVLGPISRAVVGPLGPGSSCRRPAERTARAPPPDHADRRSAMADQQQNSGEQKRVTRNADKSRYEIFLGDQLAGFVEYEESGDRIDFVHTEIDDAFSGQGLGSAPAERALNGAAAGGRANVASCRSLPGYMDRHPEEARHLAGSGR